jgi:hypothetical protein
MISAQPNRPTQERLIEKLMELPNNAVGLVPHTLDAAVADGYSGTA